VSHETIQRLRYAKMIGGLARELQRHIVQVPRKDRFQMIQLGLAEVIREQEYGQQFVLLSAHNLYDANTGLRWTDLTGRTPESNIM
jgi:hypothetical protein